MLIDLQMYMGNIRERLERIEGKFFSPEELEVLQFEKYKHPYLRKLPILAVLMGTAAFGALLVGYGIWRYF